MKYLEYNEQNLNLVSDLIVKNLTPDLLPNSWIQRNARNKMFGHCHNASGCLYKIFGPENIKLHRALDYQLIYHWWAIDKYGKLIDLTADQYYEDGRLPPHTYEPGEKASILGFEYRNRVAKLTKKVAEELNKLGFDIEIEKEDYDTLDKFFEV